MSDDHRRKTLKGLVFTVPAVWSVPLVQSVLLPVHAQTSPMDESDGNGGGGGNGGNDVDPLCCVSVTGLSEGNLALFNGLVQGRVGACYPTCNGANIQLVQGLNTLDIFGVFCSGAAGDCGAVNCAVGGSGGSNPVGGTGNLFPGSETAEPEITPGPATIRVLTSQGVCGEFGITLVPFEM